MLKMEQDLIENMNKIRLSIVIPVYRVEKYLRKCLDSLVSQLNDEVEVLLVDDGSDDSSPMICDEYADKYEQIKVVHKENGGLSSAVRAGIDNSCGEYIGFCDSDDWVADDYIEEIFKVLDNHTVDVICFNFRRVYESDGKTEDCISGAIAPGLHTGDSCTDLKNSFNRPGGITPTRWTKVVNKSMVDLTMPFYSPDSKIGEDILFNTPIIYQMSSLYYIDKTLINYRINDGSMTQHFNKRYINDFNLIFDVLSPNFENDKKYLGYIHYINMRTMVNAVGKSDLPHKKKYLSEIFGTKEFKDRLSWTDASTLSFKDRMFLSLMKKKMCGVLLSVAYFYRKLK